MLFSLFQRFLPKHLLSRVVGKLAASKSPWIKSTFINVFCFFFDINLKEAERSSREEYESFNDFFTRSLKPDARTIRGRISSPVDGTVAAMGDLSGDTLIQSKNHEYSVKRLLASEDTQDYRQGSFITIYLAPHDYHRVHVPCTAELRQATYVPGDLFSVNQTTADHLPNLFARNERLVCRFHTSIGAMSYVMVGAMLVAGIKTVWMDEPYKPRLAMTTGMRQVFSAGEELGQFQMGSTVILLFQRRQIFKVSEGQTIRLGDPLV